MFSVNLECWKFYVSKKEVLHLNTGSYCIFMALSKACFVYTHQPTEIIQWQTEEMITLRTLSERLCKLLNLSSCMRWKGFGIVFNVWKRNLTKRFFFFLILTFLRFFFGIWEGRLLVAKLLEQLWVVLVPFDWKLKLERNDRRTESINYVPIIRRTYR